MISKPMRWDVYYVRGQEVSREEWLVTVGSDKPRGFNAWETVFRREEVKGES